MYRYRDNAGSTAASLAAFSKHLHKIGKLRSVKGYLYYGRYNTYHAAVMIKGDKGTLRLAGCGWGYNGTGPNGTRQVLRQLGFTQEQIEFAISHPWDTFQEAGVRWEINPEQNLLPMLHNDWPMLHKETDHRHQCYYCQTVWQHPNSCVGSDESHQCPCCGKERFLKYKGDKEPDIIFVGAHYFSPIVSALFKTVV